jgi:hypothetical protein
MLVNKSRTQNFVAASAVNVKEGSGEAVAYFNGTINDANEVVTNMRIQNMDLFNAHKDEVLADRAAFDEEVYSYAEPTK